MTAEVFIDSNILLYSCSSSPEDVAKQKVAEKLVLDLKFGLSSQVLQEFVSNALKKKNLCISEPQIDATLEMATLVPVQPVTLELICSAVELRRRMSISHWDSTIIAAAIELGCHRIYSEDLNHGQKYDGVEVINPFLSM